MRYLVTGASGFIGSSLANNLACDKNNEVFGTYCNNKPLKSLPHELIQMDLDYFDKDFKNFLKWFRPEVIFHLAAKSTVKQEENACVSELYQSNVYPTHFLCEHCREGTHIVFASSVLVYGDKTIQCYEGCECNPTSMYGVTKLSSEGVLRTYDHKITHTNLRLCATVGNANLLTHGIVKDFVRKLKENDVLDMLGDAPGSTKPFSHINDVISAFKIAETIRGTYNVVPDDNINVEQVAKAVMEGLGVEKETNWLGSEANWKGDNRLVNCSNEKLKRTGWTPIFSSYSAIVDAANYAKS